MNKGYLRNIFLPLIIFSCSACSGTLKHNQGQLCEDLIIPGSKLSKHLAEKGYEVPPVLNSATFLPKRMKASPIYTVRDAVYSDGALDHYQIDSKWGTYYAGGTYQLKTRLNELIAIDALSKISATDAAVDGVVGGVEGLVMAPFNAVGAISSLFSGSPDRKETRTISEPEPVDFTKQKTKKSDIDLDNSRVGKLVKKGREYYTPIPAPTVEAQGQGLVGGLLGYNDKVAEIQKEFHIDPFSDNEVLRSEIQRVARAKASGSMTTSLSSSSAAALSALSTINTAAGVVNSISIYADEASQRELIHKELLKAGISDALYKRFEEAPGLSLLFRTQITNIIMQLKGVNDRDELIKLASFAEDYEVGQSFLMMFATLPKLYNEVHFTRFINDVPLPTAVTKDGRAFIAVAADHLYWTEGADILVNETLNGIIEDGKVHTVEMRITAKASPRFRAELQKRGIRVVEVEDPAKFTL